MQILQKLCRIFRHREMSDALHFTKGGSTDGFMSFTTLFQGCAEIVFPRKDMDSYLGRVDS